MRKEEAHNKEENCLNLIQRIYFWFVFELGCCASLVIRMSMKRGKTEHRTCFRFFFDCVDLCLVLLTCEIDHMRVFEDLSLLFQFKTMPLFNGIFQSKYNQDAYPPFSIDQKNLHIYLI